MDESKPTYPLKSGCDEPVKPSGLRVLYMEDDSGLARLIQKKLERAGYIVDLARDGEEGLDMYAAGSYDVVAVDQHMPVHDGLEVIRILASQGPLLPAIMVTGTGNERIAVEAMKLGARDYIVKDVEGAYLDLLPAVIEQVIQQQRLIEEKQQADEERERLIRELQEALAEIKTLRGILPICSFCKKIRDDEGYWKRLEVYIQEHSEAVFSHGLCPECAKKQYPGFFGGDDQTASAGVRR